MLYPLFFQKDYVDLIRHFPELSREVGQSQEVRLQFFRERLQQLQMDGFLRKSLGVRELDYLMELSGAMRTFFFLRLQPEEFRAVDLKQRYLRYINELFFPYLSGKGRKVYAKYMEKVNGSG